MAAEEWGVILGLLGTVGALGSALYTRSQTRELRRQFAEQTEAHFVLIGRVVPLDLDTPLAPLEEWVLRNTGRGDAWRVSVTLGHEPYKPPQSFNRLEAEAERLIPLDGIAGSEVTRRLTSRDPVTAEVTWSTPYGRTRRQKLLFGESWELRERKTPPPSPDGHAL